MRNTISSTFLASLFLLLGLTQSAFAMSTNGWHRSLLVGYGIATAEQSQDVLLSITPSPGLVNRYIGPSTHFGEGMIGLGLEKEFPIGRPGVKADVGVELDYMNNKNVNGVVEPMINISPNFDELRYGYDIHTLFLQATGKYLFEELIGQFSGYLQAGLGLVVNRMSDYREYAPDNSTASPMLAAFHNKDTTNIAFSAGLGLAHKCGKTGRLSFGYRFMYAGSAGLNKSPLQQTNQSIELASINYHFVLIQYSI